MVILVFYSLERKLTRKVYISMPLNQILYKLTSLINIGIDLGYQHSLYVNHDVKYMSDLRYR